MRPSSRAILAVALVLLVAAVYLYVHSLDRAAPPLDNRVATALINRGKAAFEKRDVNGVMALIAPDARVLGQRPDQLRLLLTRAMHEMNSGHPTASFGNVQSTPEGSDHGFVTFDLTVGQQATGQDLTFYPNLRVLLQVRKVRQTHWLGLYHTEEWQIVQADTTPGIEL